MGVGEDVRMIDVRMMKRADEIGGVWGGGIRREERGWKRSDSTGVGESRAGEFPGSVAPFAGNR